jgi:GT2 family glycosyltransferase
MTDVSVVVVSYNTRDLLAECLRSVRRTLVGLETETFVVDNNSQDGSASMVAEAFPWATVIENKENVGFARANNQAIALSRGRYVLLLNSDAVLEPGGVQEMVRFMDRHPEVGITGGQLLNPDGSFQGSYCDFPTLLSELALLTRVSSIIFPSSYPSYPVQRSQEPRPVDWVSGAFLMARSTAIAQVGPLDPDYFMYTEETDWCFRMRQRGWSVWYLPAARVRHWGGQSSQNTPRLKRGQLYGSKRRFMRKYRGEFVATVYEAAVRFFSVLKLGFWAVRSFFGDPNRREQARAQVRSYMVLLRSF